LRKCPRAHGAKQGFVRERPTRTKEALGWGGKQIRELLATSWGGQPRTGKWSFSKKTDPSKYPKEGGEATKKRTVRRIRNADARNRGGGKGFKTARQNMQAKREKKTKKAFSGAWTGGPMKMCGKKAIRGVVSGKGEASRRVRKLK